MNNTIIVPDRQLDYVAVEQQLVEQIQDYVSNQAHAESCIVWVSWGIDSAVVSTLAAKTQLQTVLLTMPIHQAIDQVTRADEHIAALKARYPNIIHYNIDLTQPYEAIKQQLLTTGLSEAELYLSLVNTRSRLRMATLYGIAPAHNGLVLGTGNKVEDYGIWFFTKYGDGGVDYSPIGNLLKSEVYKLGAHMWVIADILNAAPTDGLHPNWATDEDQIGASYDELEWAMEQYDLGLRAQDFTDRQAEVMRIYGQRHEINHHKMAMPPVAELLV